MNEKLAELDELSAQLESAVLPNRQLEYGRKIAHLSIEVIGELSKKLAVLEEVMGIEKAPEPVES